MIWSCADNELFLMYGWPTKTFNLISSRHKLSEILTIANFRHAASRIWGCENLSSGLVEWSCVVMINTTPQRYYYNHYSTALYVERLGYEFATMFVTFVCISYFASQICFNLTRDTFLVSREKKGDKVCIVLWNIDVRMFDILNGHDGIHQFNC